MTRPPYRLARTTSPAARALAATLAIAAAASALTACAPLVIGGAVGGALVATDRRTSGTQLEDKTIQLKAGNRIRDALGERGHTNANSYNRVVLLTGEVPTEADRSAVEAAVAGIENVRSVVNELAVMGNTSLTARSSDVIIEGKIRATYVDARDVMSNAYKIVVERGVVYLMGRVTEREAERAVELARSVSGVAKVVRVFEIISEEELARLTPKPATAASGAASSGK